MTEGCFNYFNRVRVAPQDSASSSPRSWSDKSLLTTQQKIYAISNGFTQDIEAAARRRETKGWVDVARKWTGKSPWRLPWVMIVFSAVQLIFNSFDPSDVTYQLLAFSSNHKSETWRFVTYSLLHAGTAHLAINIVLQLVIALPLETEVGHVRTLAVYFGGVVCGSLAASLNNDGLLMVGASSGIYGLLMSHLSHLYLNYKELAHKLYRVIFVTFLTLSDIVHSLTHCLLNNNEEPKIHITAHAAGAISGLLLGFVFYERQATKPKEVDEESTAKGANVIRLISIASSLLFLCFVIVFNSLS